MADSLTGNVVWLVAGLGVLGLAADRFVKGAALLASRLGVSKVVAGALIIGLGTSAPELVVSVLAVWQGAEGTKLAVGNIVGSNMANLGLVLALLALVWGRFAIPRGTARQAALSLSGVSVFALVAAIGQPSEWIWGALLVLCLAVAMRGVVWLGKGFATQSSETPETVESTAFGAWTLTVLGLVGTVAGAHVVVESSIEIGEELGWTGGFVGFTLVAVGTSLPELVTGAAAARRSQWGLIIGNLLGSNLFNSLGVGAAVFLVHLFKDLGPLDTFIDNWVLLGMVAASLVTLLIMGTKRVSRWEAASMLALYGLVLWRMTAAAIV